ncbi:MAG: DUF3768 domain-containing protein [Anderseniella sp.]
MSTIAPRLDRIRALNDVLRTTGLCGRVYLSRAVTSLDEMARQEILHAVALFDDFTDDNDPYGEHDCAIVSSDNYRVMFKIDYFDPSLSRHSEDPSDPKVTVRVLTIMFPEEY